MCSRWRDKLCDKSLDSVGDDGRGGIGSICVSGWEQIVWLTTSSSNGMGLNSISNIVSSVIDRGQERIIILRRQAGRRLSDGDYSGHWIREIALTKIIDF